MKKFFLPAMAIIMAVALLTGCSQPVKKTAAVLNPFDSTLQAKISQFAVVKLTTDLTKLTEKEKKMIPLLINASKIMDDLFWLQAFGDKNVFFTG